MVNTAVPISSSAAPQTSTDNPATVAPSLHSRQPAPLPKWHVADVAQRALRTLAKAKHVEAFGLFCTLMAACCGKCRCWPSTRALMDWTELPRRTIERHRAVLIAAGLVTADQPGGRRLIYELPGLVEAGYPRKATAASTPTPKVTRAEGSNVLEVDFDPEPAPDPADSASDPAPADDPAPDEQEAMFWETFAPWAVDERAEQRRAEYEKLRAEAVPAPPRDVATVATGGDPGSPRTATPPKGTKRSSADETPPGFHSAERERESAPATADAAGADSPAQVRAGTCYRTGRGRKSGSFLTEPTGRR